MESLERGWNLHDLASRREKVGLCIVRLDGKGSLLVLHSDRCLFDFFPPKRKKKKKKKNKKKDGRGGGEGNGAVQPHATG
jgi:hypothetical protein